MQAMKRHLIFGILVAMFAISPSDDFVIFFHIVFNFVMAFLTATFFSILHAQIKYTSRPICMDAAVVIRHSSSKRT